MDKIEIEDVYKIIVIERDNLRYYVGFDTEQREYYASTNIMYALPFNTYLWGGGELLDIGQSVSDEQGIYPDTIRIAKIKVTYKEE